MIDITTDTDTDDVTPEELTERSLGDSPLETLLSTDATVDDINRALETLGDGVEDENEAADAALAAEHERLGVDPSVHLDLAAEDLADMGVVSTADMNNEDDDADVISWTHDLDDLVRIGAVMAAGQLVVFHRGREAQYVIDVMLTGETFAAAVFQYVSNAQVAFEDSRIADMRRQVDSMMELIDDRMAAQELPSIREGIVMEHVTV